MGSSPLGQPVVIKVGSAGASAADLVGHQWRAVLGRVLLALLAISGG